METSHRHKNFRMNSRSISLWAVIVLATVGIPTTEAVYPREGFPDLPGDYCRVRRPTQCCDGRFDDCSVPISGTLCYCDQFCDRNENPDCCPDFWSVCKGAPPPITSCYQGGRYFQPGDKIKDNCKECVCGRDGQMRCDREEPCMIEERIIREVNLAPRQFGWRASNYSEYWGRKARDGLVLKTGTLNPELLSLKMYPIILQPDLNRIPREFDARNKREWRGRIGEVRDQGWCGSSWAFSTLGVAEDRLSIESFGNETVKLAPQHLLSCDRRGQKGCEGGHVDRAWQYLRKIGVVNEECYKYESGSTGKVPKCSIPRGTDLSQLRCAASQTVYKRQNFYKTEPAYRISGKEEDIQWEIMNNGPVQAMMKVHRDLFMYKSGVYANTGLAGGETGSHSVKILGWGVDRDLGMKYWLVANSWGKQWGEQGYFRVKRGSNESEIETFILAVRARLGQYSSWRFRANRGRRNRLRANRRRTSRRTASYYEHHQ